MVHKPTYIDLFAGCGGLSLGLHNAGWKGLFAIEKNPDAFKTLEYNLIKHRNHFDWPVEWLPIQNYDIKVVLRNYRKQLLELQGKVDMVTGGPPCQGFSTAGKRDEKDRRNQLITDYIRFINLVKPKVLFFENVKGFTLGFDKNKIIGRRYSTYVSDRLRSLGYKVAGSMIDFSKYGIPQKRCRFILVGVREDLVKEKGIAAQDFFEKIELNRNQFLSNKGLSLNVTLQDAISDLLRAHGETVSPDTKIYKAGLYSEHQSNYQKLLRVNKKIGETADSHRFVRHKHYIVERFQYILQSCQRNKSICDPIREKYRLNKHTIVPLDPEDATPTLTTLPDDYIHYLEPRILTVREYARIQSFPDDFLFKGKYTTGSKERTKEVPRYTQIGNAIPPLFGEQSGLTLKQLL